MIDFAFFKHFIFTVSISMVRMSSVFAIAPFFGSQLLPGYIRNGIVLSFTFFIYPLVSPGVPEGMSESIFLFMGIILKEAFIGILIGFSGGIVFWAAECAGAFMDNQRGATMGGSINPMTQMEDSPLGILFQQILIVLFFTSGGFLIFLFGLLKSYKVWPIFSFYPKLDLALTIYILQQVDTLIRLAVVLASPIVITIFVAELGLGLINRFAPQFNVFFLSLPIKSGITSLLLIFYLTILIYALKRHFPTVELMFNFLEKAVQ
jgi:type III secretion protein T